MSLLLMVWSYMVASCVIILKERNNFISVLIGSELFLLCMFGWGGILTVQWLSMGCLSGVIMLLICFGVCESCLSMGVLTSMGREKGGSKVSSLSAFKIN
uniref:NADH dehydrogenase subunit 4L n=1 Tax=Hiatella arctica TaxID=120431 RepID=Q06SB6_9BIVA|nr:NADH dehydrogenase subunit 4L [Hiatella arctica]